METKLARIAEIAKANPKEVFTSLYHYLNKEMLLQCHQELSENKASGVDAVTKEEYAENLEENISKLVERLKKHSYKPQPVRRVYIPKDNARELRPLGIPAYEDKIVQQGLNKILQAIYEADFLGISYGFRPNLGCLNALAELDYKIMGKTSYIVDADIKGFFDNIDHEWLIKFIGVRVADPNIKRLINKFLKAGVMKEGAIEPTETGTPQGGIISPLLANVYLHYALDLWFEKAIKPRLQGEASLIRYADDFVCCFQFREEAAQFYVVLKERLAKFKLEIAESKSKIIEFGRFAARSRKTKGLGKPETFDFLGFTHYCSQGRSGKFTVKRKTSKKKFKAKVKAFATWIKRTKDKESIQQIFETTRKKLQGHYNYYGITYNSPMMGEYYLRVIELLYKWLNRRSQRKSFTWEHFKMYLKQDPLPRPRIIHRFCAGQVISVR
jgi:group II intron reverse transcriptase/maturase